MPSKRLGRPRFDAREKRQATSFALGASLIRWLDSVSKQHGVSRSQIIDDAIKVYRGEMEDTLRHLREELAGQEENVKTLIALGKQKDEELTRLKASQQMMGSILSPIGGPTSELSKEAKERARTLRAVVHNPNNVFEVSMLVSGKLPSPTKPILADAYKAWGSWTGLMDAIIEAERAKEAQQHG